MMIKNVIIFIFVSSCKNHVALQFHLKAHIPPEEKYKFKCDICDKKFVSLENYEKHQYLVHESK